jgi:hypothetical protein
MWGEGKEGVMGGIEHRSTPAAAPLTARLPLLPPLPSLVQERRGQSAERAAQRPAGGRAAGGAGGDSCGGRRARRWRRQRRGGHCCGGWVRL